MRPRKLILFVHPSEQERAEFKFMLETMGPYRVLAAENKIEAIALFAAGGADLVLAADNDAIERLKLMRSYTPMILLGNTPSLWRRTVADAVLDRKTCSNMELLLRITVMSARKRGPRKGSQRMVTA